MPSTARHGDGRQQFFYGIFMGALCVKVDYTKAFDLMRRGGADLNPYIAKLRECAALGNPDAKFALDRYGP